MRKELQRLYDLYGETPFELAQEIAMEVHSGQVDKAGASYYRHAFAVGGAVESVGGAIVGYLHDTVEDQPDRITLDEIEEMFGVEIRNSVDAITHRKGRETYKEYIERCAADKYAREAKIEDLKHNADLTRFEGMPPKDILGMIVDRIIPSLHRLMKD